MVAAGALWRLEKIKEDGYTSMTPRVCEDYATAKRRAGVIIPAGLGAGLMGWKM